MRGFFRDLGAEGKSRLDHGTVSTGSETFSAKTTHHKITTGGSFTLLITDLSEQDPEFSVKITVSGGTPTITLSGGTPTIATDSAQTLSTMAAGVYLAECVSFDNGVTSEWLVGQVS